MTTTHATLLAAAVLGLGACQSAGAGTASQTDAQAATEVALGGVAGGAARLRPGQSLSIVLPSNGSTGYVWRLADFDTAVLTRGAPFGAEATDPHPAGMVGVGGRTQWRFEAAAPGTTTLVFTYAQPWDTTAAPAQTARYVITVR
jgi:inhibitor of cysteine peptidase